MQSQQQLTKTAPYASYQHPHSGRLWQHKHNRSTILYQHCQHPPTATSSGATGSQDTYRTNEDVYAAGSGFATGMNVDIPGSELERWQSDPFRCHRFGRDRIRCESDIAPVLVWHAPLVIGEYDIVIDANRNGVYDAPIDGLDSGSPGFVVVADAPPTPPVPVPAIAPIGIIGLLCIIGTFMVGRRFN